MQFVYSEPQKLAEQMMWLAFLASVPAGLGMLHTEAASRATIADVINSTSRRNSYNKTTLMRADYVFGRMMKTIIEFDETSVYMDDPHSFDYQSWILKYPTAKHLVDAAKANLEGHSCP